MRHEAFLEGLTRLLSAEDLTQSLAHEFFQLQIQPFLQVGFLDESNHTLKDQLGFLFLEVLHQDLQKCLHLFIHRTH